MMQIQLSLLGASLLVAGNAAAITIAPGDNAILIFNTPGQGSYLIDTGKSADLLIQTGQEAGFRINIETAAAALGGTIEEFAMIGFTSATFNAEPVYNYDLFLYVDPGIGILYGGIAEVRTATDLLNANALFSEYLSGAHYGLNSEGSAGDIDNLLSSVSQIDIEESLLDLNIDAEFSGRGSPIHYFLNEEGNIESSGFLGGLWVDELAYPYHDCPNADPYAPFDEDITDCLIFTSRGFSLKGNTFGFGAVPVPGAAWLFGSALMALVGVQRRQSQRK